MGGHSYRDNFNYSGISRDGKRVICPRLDRVEAGGKGEAPLLRGVEALPLTRRLCWVPMRGCRGCPPRGWELRWGGGHRTVPISEGDKQEKMQEAVSGTFRGDQSPPHGAASRT